MSGPEYYESAWHAALPKEEADAPVESFDTINGLLQDYVEDFVTRESVREAVLTHGIRATVALFNSKLQRELGIIVLGEREYNEFLEACDGEWDVSDRIMEAAKRSREEGVR